MDQRTILFVLLLFLASACGYQQAGLDPWHYEELAPPAEIKEADVPPDLRGPLVKVKESENTLVFGEWWFKRLLALVLKSGNVKKNEDGDIDISIQMRYNKDKWKLLEQCLKSESSLPDDMFRRAVGYVEEAIYKPTVTEQIVMAWSDYVQVYLSEYKAYITYFFGTSAAVAVLAWLWRHVSHKHIIIVILSLLYIYEVVISYKEAEKKEYEMFVSAMNSCKWYFWTSECTVPAPDPIVFMKHMNPLKIAIRMFTTIISEPILVINSIVKEILQDITGGLWYPFDKIVYGLLIVVINISLIYLLIIIVFNFIFNISVDYNFLGIISIGLKRNRRNLFPANANEPQPQVQDVDRIGGERLDKLLNAFTLALTAQNRSNINMPVANNVYVPQLRRSASTGRLPSIRALEDNNHSVNPNLRRRNVLGQGDGDH